MITGIQQERDREAQSLQKKRESLARILASLRDVQNLTDEIAASTVRVANLDAMLATWNKPPAGPVTTPTEPRKRTSARSKPKTLPAPDITKGVAGTIVRALEQAGPAGLSGGELNKVVEDAQFTIDAAEKTKSRLKKNGLVIHNKLAQRWYAIVKDDLLRE